MRELKLRTAILALAFFSLVTACGQKSQTENGAKDSGAVAEQESARDNEATPDADATPDATTNTETDTPKSKPQLATVEIPAGMNIVISLDEALETGQTNTGDEFSGTLVDSIVVNGKEVFPAGAHVRGTVLNAVASGRLKTDAELSLTLTHIGDVHVATDAIEDKASSHKDRNKKLIGGGAIVGGIIGAIKGKNVKGAIVGAAAGAAAGTGAAALTGKKNLRYEPGTLMQFTLTESAKAPVKE